MTEEKKVLLLQKPSSSKNCGVWNLPGGKAESGECFKECVIREIREETGITVISVGAVLHKEILSTGDYVIVYEIVDWRLSKAFQLNHESSSYAIVDRETVSHMKVFPYLKKLLSLEVFNDGTE